MPARHKTAILGQELARLTRRSKTKGDSLRDAAPGRPQRTSTSLGPSLASGRVAPGAFRDALGSPLRFDLRFCSCGAILRQKVLEVRARKTAAQ